MVQTFWTAGLGLALGLLGASAAAAQPALVDLMTRHGVELPNRSFERAFDEGLAPVVPVTPGSLAAPLAVLASATGGEQVNAAFALGILAGRSGRAAAPPELAAAGQALVPMLSAADRRSRVAAARVAGRIFAVPLTGGAPPALPPGLADGLFGLLNRDHEVDQLAAMDALGLLRQASAVTSLTERYAFYRDTGKRALAGGALEALARIGDPSTVALVSRLVADPWAGGRDATALAVLFARERMLKDGSIAGIREALGDRARSGQARGYLAELGAAAP
jgi:hypothetical protein